MGLTHENYPNDESCVNLLVCKWCVTSFIGYRTFIKENMLFMGAAASTDLIQNWAFLINT